MSPLVEELHGELVLGLVDDAERLEQVARVLDVGVDVRLARRAERTDVVAATVPPLLMVAMGVPCRRSVASKRRDSSPPSMRTPASEYGQSAGMGRAWSYRSSFSRASWWRSC